MMKLGTLAKTLIAGALCLLWTTSVAAQCPEGTVQVDEERVPQGNNVVVVHPVCERVTLPPTETARVYRPSGSGLVGGTGWQLGYYSPVGASAEVQARAREMVRDQARAAGARYDEQIDFDRYSFVIGIANSTTFWRDLATRVVFEQLFNGQLTAAPNYQAAYNSLRDRQFSELGCHSNGAMICLAALVNRDVMADDVVLYGPQVTAESLGLWNELLDEGRIKSLRILVNQNDPVTPAALLATPTNLSSAFGPALAAPLFFNSDSLRTALRVISPRASVTTFPCGSRPSLDCHDMGIYSNHLRRCARAATGATVPGTRNPGGRRAAEPPPPGCE